MPEHTLGVYVGVHGTSCSLLRDGVPIVAVQLERILGIKRAWIAGSRYNTKFCQTRVLHDSQKKVLDFSSHFEKLVNYVLSAANIKLSQLDSIAIEKRNLLNCPLGGNLEDRNNELEVFFETVPCIKRIEHHQGHQAQAFYSSPFKDALIITIDGRSWDHVERINGPICLTVSIGSKRGIETIHESSQSLTSDYYDLSMQLFKSRNCEGKTMGLSSYGVLQDELKNSKYNYCTDYHKNLSFSNNESFTQFYKMIVERSKQFKISELKPLIRGNTPSKEQVEAAWHCQKNYETDLLSIIKVAYKEFGIKNLCISGGGGLNSVANGLILDETPIDNLHIFPNCGDEGQSMGFALWAYYNDLSKKRKWYMTHDFFGKVYSVQDFETALKKRKDSITFARHDNICDVTAQLLASGSVVGWFQNGSEFGPRALGNRSIFAHPGIKGLRDDINTKVKHREEWRPFAPVILEEHVSDYFDFSGSSPFMLIVRNVLNCKKTEIPNVVHVDGTARLQTVSSNYNSLLRVLLYKFFKIVGVPVLLNTSLNIAGNPIAETPDDAISILMHSDLDLLVIGNYLVKRKRNNEKNSNLFRRR